MTLRWVASITSKAGTSAPTGIISISSRPPESALTRSAKSLEFSKDVLEGGNDDWQRSFVCAWAETVVTPAASSDAAHATRKRASFVGTTGPPLVRYP